MLGMALIRSGKAEEGQVRVERLMRGGDTAEAHYLLGAASFMGREYPRALQDFSKALALDPRLPSLRSYYGQALLFTGDPEGAERELREALADDPNDYEANYYLASILAVRQRPAEARPLAEHALQLRPGSEDARKLLADLDQPGGTSPPLGRVAAPREGGARRGAPAAGGRDVPPVVAAGAARRARLRQLHLPAVPPRGPGAEPAARALRRPGRGSCSSTSAKRTRRASRGRARSTSGRGSAFPRRAARRSASRTPRSPGSASTSATR